MPSGTEESSRPGGGVGGGQLQVLQRRVGTSGVGGVGGYDYDEDETTAELLEKGRT